MPKVFLSYAHQDNAFPKDWVSVFYENLVNQLSVHSGKRDLEVWKDDICRDFEDESILTQIKRGLDESEIFIALISPSYQSGWWGSFERKYFLNFAKIAVDAPLNERHERIHNVIKLNIQAEHRKAFFEEAKNTFVYNFCRERNGSPYTIDHNDQQYDITMTMLANSIAKKLGQKAVKRTIKLLIADSPEDVLHFEMRLRNELESHPNLSFEIYTGDDIIGDEDDTVSKFDLSIHMFGVGRGIEKSIDQWRTVVKGFEVALEMNAEPSREAVQERIRMIAWAPKEIFKNEDQAAWRDLSEVHTANHCFHDFVRSNFDGLLNSILSELKK
jgi:hypothetical protein